MVTEIIEIYFLKIEKKKTFNTIILLIFVIRENNTRFILVVVLCFTKKVLYLIVNYDFLYREKQWEKNHPTM